MKIGCFGNINNFPLRIADAMKALGHDVTLWVNRPEPLHRPESIEPELHGKYPQGFRDVSYLTYADYMELSPALLEVVEELSACDVLVLNDLGHALATLIDVPHFSILTGSDLDYHANPAAINEYRTTLSKNYLMTLDGRRNLELFHAWIERQRRGISRARGISYFTRGVIPQGDLLLDGLGIEEGRRIFIHMGQAEFRKVPAQPRSPIRVVNGARLNWRRYGGSAESELDLKGTDVLIRGFRIALDMGASMQLELFRKGRNISETEALVDELGLSASVNWHAETDQQSFYRLISQCDVVADSIHFGSVPGMVSLDAMAMGIPVVANARREIVGLWGEDVPICHATNQDEVAAHLVRLAGDCELRAELGLKGTEYVKRNKSPEVFAAKVLSFFEECVGPDPENYFTIDLPTTAMIRVAGYGHLVDLRAYSHTGDTENQPDRSPALLFEDGRKLGPPHAAHAAIHRSGRGRYSHWHHEFHFSTSDNTDPAINGRRYQVALPRTCAPEGSKHCEQ